MVGLRLGVAIAALVAQASTVVTPSADNAQTPTVGSPHGMEGANDEQEGLHRHHPRRLHQHHPQRPMQPVSGKSNPSAVQPRRVAVNNFGGIEVDLARLEVTSELLSIPQSRDTEGACLQLATNGSVLFTHSCDEHALRRVACEPTTARPLLAQLAAMQSEPSRAASFGCLLRAMNMAGVTLAGAAEVATVAAHLADDDFAVRLAAGESLALLTPRGCSACAATIARSLDEREISVRWIAVNALERLGYSRLNAAAAAVEESRSDGGGGRSAEPSLVSTFLERLAPPGSPGTRWMAVKCVALFGNAHDPALLTPLVRRLDDDDMGFPGVGMAALEAIADVYGGGGVPLLEMVVEAMLPVLVGADSPIAEAEVPRALAVELLHRLGQRAAGERGRVERAVVRLRSLERHKDVYVRAAVAHAIGAIASDPSASLAILAKDVARLVRCSAAVATAMGEQRVLGWSAWVLPAECAEPDWGGVHAAYLRNASGGEDDEYAQFVDAPFSILPHMSAAPVSEEGAHLCMSLLHGPRGGEEVSLVGWGDVHHIRGLAFFMLRYIAAQWPTVVKLRAMEMLTTGADEMIRFAAVKALGLVAMVSDIGAISAFAGALADEDDVIRWAAGAQSPRISISPSMTFQTFLG